MPSDTDGHANREWLGQIIGFREAVEGEDWNLALSLVEDSDIENMDTYLQQFREFVAEYNRLSQKETSDALTPDPDSFANIQCLYQDLMEAAVNYDNALSDLERTHHESEMASIMDKIRDALIQSGDLEGLIELERVQHGLNAAFGCGMSETTETSRTSFASLVRLKIFLLK